MSNKDKNQLTIILSVIIVIVLLFIGGYTLIHNMHRGDVTTSPQVPAQTESLPAESEAPGEVSIFPEGSPAYINGALTVDTSTGKIVNKNGEVFVIRGVSTVNLGWRPEYINYDAFKELRDKWNVNTIRIVMPVEDNRGYVYPKYREQLLQYMIDGIEYATELGMYAIVDWHVLLDGNPLSYNMEASSFITYIADHYGDRDNVIFEICNEPNGEDGTWASVKSYADRVISFIRQFSPRSLILVGTPNFCQDLDEVMADPITFYSNIAYTYHFYTITHREDMLETLEKAIKSRFPMVVSEFGLAGHTHSGTIDIAMGNRWMTLLEMYDIGRVYYNLSNENDSCALLVPSCSKMSDWSMEDLTQQGKWLIETYHKDKSDWAEAFANFGTVNRIAVKELSDTEKIEATLVREAFWAKDSKQEGRYTLTINNDTDTPITGWSVKVTFSDDFTISSDWSAKLEQEGKTLTITPLEWNNAVWNRYSIDVGFITSSNDLLRITSITFDYDGNDDAEIVELTETTVAEETEAEAEA
ncbi:MAG: cellulase family glycosylhydrolase, partial [Eubacteriales bacterium]|nr:cellulase family glycosylhydrolase [Eubacteriales bacterium]